MFNQETTQVSLYDRTTNPTPLKSVSIYEVYRHIVGEGTLFPVKRLTEGLRSISDPDPEREKDLKREFKKQNFPAVSFGGEFTRRANDKLVRSSNLACLDFDHIGTTEQVEEVKQRIAQETELDPVLLFISPSGDGLKVVVNIRQEIRNDSDFKGVFKSLRRFCQERLNLNPDEARKDISGLCYLPYDENAVLNQAGAGFDVEKWKPVETPRQAPVVPPQRPIRTETSDDDVPPYVRALIAVEDIERSGIDITSDRNQWMRIGFALATLGEDGRDLFHRVSRFYPNYDPRETDEQFDSFLRSGGDGIRLESLFAIAKEHGVSLRSSNVYSPKPQKEVKSGGSQVEGTLSPSRPVEAPQGKGKQAPEDETTRLRNLLSPTTENEIIERGKNRPPSLSTGYVVRKGQTPQRILLPSGKLIEIAGQTGHGKTLFLLNILLNVSKLNPDRRFVLFTYEEDSDTIIGYLLNIYLSDLNLMKGGDWRSNRILISEYLRGGETENFNPSSVAEFLRRKDLFFRLYIETGRILIKYVDSESSRLCKDIRLLSAPENNVGGVFIDYFQYINPDPEKRFPTRQEALKSICIELKDIANETQLPVVLACQFNQEVQAPTDVLLNKIGEAGDISRIGSETLGLWQMGKDLGRKLDNDDKRKVEDLEQKSQLMGLNDPFLKGMFVRSLKSRLIESGSEEMFKFRGLTGKIYPNDPQDEKQLVEDWDRQEPETEQTEQQSLSFLDDLPL